MMQNYSNPINSRYTMMVEVGTAQTRGKEENASWGRTRKCPPAPPSPFLPLQPAPPSVTAGGSKLAGLPVWEQFGRLSGVGGILLASTIGQLYQRCQCGSMMAGLHVRACYQSLSSESMFACLLANVGVCWARLQVWKDEIEARLCLLGGY